MRRVWQEYLKETHWLRAAIYVHDIAKDAWLLEYSGVSPAIAQAKIQALNLRCFRLEAPNAGGIGSLGSVI